jgi:ring-1,2-phenylacetyl-CoA epoxidase subunit PaaC
MSFDNAYEAITETNDVRWAFGTGFSEPLAGIDTSIPEGIDGDLLATYCVMLGDDALIMSHRLQEWCSYAPELEDDVALANIGLDLLGQARLFFGRAGHADGSDRDEDAWAFDRDEHEFRNVRLVELENGDFAFSIARLLVFSVWRLALLDRLRTSRDPVIAAVAAKGIKEVAYHRDYAARWVVRLGDGTDLSNDRMSDALTLLWPYLDELFLTHRVESHLDEQGVGVSSRRVREDFESVMAEVLKAGHLDAPKASALPGVGGRTGRDGVHTEAMGFILAEMQSIARSNPEAVW